MTDDARGEDTARWLAAAAAGDQHAWNCLVDRYTGLLWSIARGYRLSHADAGDAVQTTWLRLVEHLENIEDAERLGGWLATTARRECLRVIRVGGRERPSAFEDAVGERPDDGPAVDSGLLLAGRDAALWRAVDGLPERCQGLLRVLMASPPPSYAEVSAALEMPIGSIGPTRQRCLDHLRRLAAAEDPLLDPTPGGI